MTASEKSPAGKSADKSAAHSADRAEETSPTTSVWLTTAAHVDFGPRGAFLDLTAAQAAKAPKGLLVEPTAEQLAQRIG